MHIVFAGLEGPREAQLKHYCFKCVAFESDKYVNIPSAATLPRPYILKAKQLAEFTFQVKKLYN